MEESPKPATDIEESPKEPVEVRIGGLVLKDPSNPNMGWKKELKANFGSIQRFQEERQ